MADKSVPVKAIKAFMYGGRDVQPGQVIAVRPVEALALRRAMKIGSLSLRHKMPTKVMRAEPSTPVFEPEPEEPSIETGSEPTTVGSPDDINVPRRTRRYRRRDMQAEE